MAKISLGRYMWERLRQAGVETIFGVPGDFNLQFLDSIFEVEGLKWVGNQNELNAAYAADGYARIKGVPGCFVTTHGVGELSALNGVAGAMCERVKMIHIVGQTTRPMQKNHMMIHHSIGHKPDHQQFNKASAGLRFAAAELWDITTAPAEIDRVIRECFVQSGPVYIFMPLDLSAEEVSTDLLKTPIDISPQVDAAAQDAAVKAILAAIQESKHPTVLIDALARRFDAAVETREFVRKLNVPFFSANMGKGVVDETEDLYVGVWNGDVSAPGVAAAAKASDLVVTLGLVPADTNSAAFSRVLKDESCVHVNAFDVVVKGTTYPNTHLKPLLAALTAALPPTPTHTLPQPVLPPPRSPSDAHVSHLTQSFLWPALASFLGPGDILVGETGTAVFGLCDISFPANVHFETQIYYGSIGWATPAALGMDIARAEMVRKDGGGRGGDVGEGKGRTVLVTGDGSLALTMQEVGTMVKQETRVVVLVVNNEGYTVERMIWGARQPYNDIVPTSYAHLLPLFQHPSPSSSFHRAATKAELSALLRKQELTHPPHVQLVELVLHRLDTAWRLASLLAHRGGEKHRQFLEREGFVDTYGGWGLEDVVGEGRVRWS